MQDSWSCLFIIVIKIADSNSISGNQCLICGKVFATPGSAKRHFDMTHLDMAEKSQPCFECGKRFRHSQLLKDHLRKTHNIYKAQYEKVYGSNILWIAVFHLWNKENFYFVTSLA
jgi:uncharacterized C2H2 Zn-finger protein